MKKSRNIIIFMVILLLVFFVKNVHTATNTAQRINTCAVLNDGDTYEYTAYDIDGYKTLQIEDLAKILDGTSANFDVMVNNKNTYIIDNKTSYSGGNSKSPQTDSLVPFYNETKVSMGADGIAKNVQAYNIDGCTYFKIRDLAALTGCNVEWNSEEFSFTLYDTESDNNEVTTLIMRPSDEVKEYLMKKSQIIDPSKPMIALTFDDGPKIGNTDRILEALKKVGGKATFFVVGEMVQKHPELVKAEYDAGCQIGNHTYSHVNLVTASEYTVNTQVNKTSNLVYDITGKYTMIGRPPYGSINDVVRKNINIPWFNWNIDTLDWKHRDADYIENFILEHAKDGDVILMHDLHSTTADAMEKCVPKLADKGFQLVTIDELVKFKYDGDVTKVPGYVK